MPTAPLVTNPTPTPNWRDNWGHLLIVLSLILLGSLAIHDFSRAPLLITLEMSLFRNHAKAKHPEHPILATWVAECAYLLLGLSMMGLGLMTSFTRPISGFNEIASHALLFVGYVAISELLHRISHCRDGLTDKDCKTLSIRDAMMIRLLLIAVPTILIAVLIANL